MVKRNILAILFFLCLTGIFGIHTPQANAQQSCTSAAGWPGTCKTSCPTRYLGSVVFDTSSGTGCSGRGVGCCAMDPAHSCQSSEGWPGVCTGRVQCIVSVGSNVVWDPNGTGCSSGGGCCAVNPNASVPTPTMTPTPTPNPNCPYDSNYTSEAKNCGTQMVCEAGGWVCIAAGTTPGATGSYCDSSKCPYGCTFIDNTGGSCISSSNSNTKVCDFAGADKSTCTACMDDGLHSWTAVGCISTVPSEFISKLLGIGVGIAGGVAFLLILFGGFQVLTSSGDPERLNAGKELVTSSIIGLLLIVFSLFILRLIGFTIFAIPGFG